MIKIAPSLLAADFLNLEKAAQTVNDYADIFHLDVMDGVFVPNISFGFPVVKAVAAMAQKPLDVHLMIVNPEKYALKFAEISGVEMVSFHVNACADPALLLRRLKDSGVKAGLALNPDIPLEAIYPYLEICDFVLVMSVFAGFGGQKFIEDSLERIAKIKAEAQSRGLQIEIEVDGGVTADNALKIKQSGADILVSGTSFFKAENPAAFISAIR